MYQDWGFSDNPFQTTSLKANAQGSQLLVGREAEVRDLTIRLASPPRAVTVEGANGVGKTSLVNVAVYRSLEKYLRTGGGPLFVPALEPFQITDETALEDFVDSVYFLLARSLIQRAKEISGFGWNLPVTSAINEWLNSPLIKRWGVNIGPVGAQASAERNDSDGYLRGAFRAEVRDWLKKVFPTPSHGGVVCLIDNLELLRTSDQARQFVEKVRDTLLGLEGVRWVFCGANGITRSVAGSARLDAYLHDPVDVSSLDSAQAGKIYDSRVAAFSSGVSKPFLPLRRADFERLFDILGKNTRSALKHADGYCLSQVGFDVLGEQEKAGRFSTWLRLEAEKVERACDGQVGNRAWQLFNAACESGNDFAPGDYSSFGFNNSPAMVPHVRSLEQNGLVSSAVDEQDQRRRTISITPKGWLIYSSRKAGGSRLL